MACMEQKEAAQASMAEVAAAKRLRLRENRINIPDEYWIAMMLGKPVPLIEKPKGS